MKKIMFNDKYSLTKAVLAGRKTQTRRAIKLKDGEYVKVVALDNGSFMSYIAKEGKPTAYVGALEMPNFVRVLAPKYFIGEEVAVAQPYNDTWQHTGYMTAFEAKHCPGYNNKMFVKAEKMPHRIKITNIRIERLQDICDSDCLKEGIIQSYNDCLRKNIFGFYDGNKKVKLTASWKVDVGFDTPREAFSALIDKVSGKGTWDSNPYVFVYDFELIK